MLNKKKNQNYMKQLKKILYFIWKKENYKINYQCFDF